MAMQGDRSRLHDSKTRMDYYNKFRKVKASTINSDRLKYLWLFHSPEDFQPAKLKVLGAKKQSGIPVE
jgi:hypothetical protein